MREILKSKMGRPAKKSSFNVDNIYSCNDDFLKTVVVHVRVSHEEKDYLLKTARRNSDNISSFIRRLIFDVYLERLRSRKSLDKYLISKGEYTFSTKRDELIHIRFTEREKIEVEKLSRLYHRGISDFIRWVSLQLPIDELICED